MIFRNFFITEKNLSVSGNFEISNSSVNPAGKWAWPKFARLLGAQRILIMERDRRTISSQRGAAAAIAAEQATCPGPPPGEPPAPVTTHEADVVSFTLPGLPEVTVCQDKRAAAGREFRNGAMVWAAAEELAAWLSSGKSVAAIGALRDYPTALELGAGSGLVAATLALLGVRRVIATDGDAGLCALLRATAARNGVSRQVEAVPLRWGSDDGLEPALADDGRCPPLIVASDVLYEWDPAAAAALERTLRALIARGGCRAVVLAWKVRNFVEERFLHRLADCGTVRTVWRQGGDEPPPADADATTRDAWCGRNSGATAIAVLTLDAEPRGKACAQLGSH